MEITGLPSPDDRLVYLSDVLDKYRAWEMREEKLMTAADAMRTTLTANDTNVVEDK